MREPHSLLARRAGIAAAIALGAIGVADPAAARDAGCAGVSPWSLARPADAGACTPPSRLGLAIRTIELPAQGAIANPPGPSGRALSFEAAYTVLGSWGLAGFYSGDATRGAQVAAPGLVVSDSRASDRLGFGVVKSATWRSGDRLSLVLSQPVGSASYRFGAEAPLASTDATLGARTTGLRAPGRDVTTELRYLAPILKSSQVGLSLINRSGAFESPDERIITIRFATQF